MNHINAIPTQYGDRLFRSRLEARWAVFFDALEIRWDYEPQTFTDGSLWYVPDFWVTGLSCFIEVKPTLPTKEEMLKADLVVAAGADIFFAVGAPTKTSEYLEGVVYDHKSGSLMDVVFCGTCDRAALCFCEERPSMKCCSDPYSHYEIRDMASDLAMRYRF